MRPLLPLLSLVAALPITAAVAQAQPANGTRLDRYQRPDGKVESYYAAGDELLVQAFALLDAHWNTLRVSPLWPQVRGELDLYLPDELRAIGHNGAIAMMRAVADEAIAGIDADDGLLRSPLNVWARLRAARHVSDLVRWFPADARLRDAAVAHVRASQSYFGGGIPGLVPYVHAGTKAPMSLQNDDWCPNDGVLMFDLANAGFAFQGMVEIAALADDPSLLPWVDDKLQFLIDERTEPSSWLLPVDYTTHHACDNGIPDTDDLYFSRYALAGTDAVDRASPGFRAAASSLRDRLRGVALANIEAWYVLGWLPFEEVFLNRVYYSGAIFNKELTGDGKWNPLYAGAAAYTATGAWRYLAQSRAHWETLRDGKRGTLIDCTYDAGRAIDGGDEPDLPLLADALATLHRAMPPGQTIGGVPPGYFAGEARRLAADLVSEAGATTCDANRRVLDNAFERDSWAMVRVALNTAAIRRLEIDTGAPGRRFVVRPCSPTQSCAVTLDTTLDATSQVAIVLLPAGIYYVTVGAATKVVYLKGPRTLTF